MSIDLEAQSSRAHSHPSDTPTKKRRLNGDADKHTSPQIQVTRSSDLWFADGNIILQVEATQFRIHRGVIASHSTVFEDMFMIPQPKMELTEEEGCPVIHLPDGAKDWGNVLMVIYMGCKMYRKLQDYKPDVIISMLRLGVKYEIDHLRDTAIGSLRVSLPRQWSGSWFRLTQKWKGYEFILIDLASQIGLQSALPTLYLMCLKHYSLDQILDGVKEENQITQYVPDGVKKTLLRGREKLILKTTELITQSEELTETKCFTALDCDIDSCVPDRMKSFREALRRLGENVIFGLLDQNISEYQSIFEIGVGCEYSELGYSWHRDLAEGLWAILPSVFDLPEWETITTSDNTKFPCAY